MIRIDDLADIAAEGGLDIKLAQVFVHEKQTTGIFLNL